MFEHAAAAVHGKAAEGAQEESTALGYGVGLTAWFLLSGMFVAAKFGISEMPPWMMCFFRLLIAMLVLLPFVAPHRHEMVEFLKRRWLVAIVVGGIGLGLTQGFVFNALVYTTATNSGIIFSVTPIITMIMAVILLREPMGPWQYAGSAIAFLGIVITAVHGSLAVLLGLAFSFGDLLVLIAAVTFSIYTVMLKKAKFELSGLPLLVILLIGAVITTFPGAAYEFATGQHANLGFDGYLALAYAAIPGGAVMYLLFNWSVSLLGASRAQSLLYSQMVFTALLAWAFLGEAIRWYHVVGAALIITGVLLIALLKPKPEAA